MTVGEPVVRAMRAADVDRVLEIAAGLPTAPHWPRAAYVAALDAQAKPRRVALIAEAGGSVQGFAVALVLGEESELELIAVAEAGQRRGVGGLLLGALTKMAFSAGARVMLLEARASNAGALAFYRAQGWSEAGLRPRYYADPEEDAVLLRQALQG
jgi:ribosomal protein S18 acetylase RimI-like enzyme